MFSSLSRNFFIGTALVALILLTRTNHFGSSIYLPDATIAVLFVGGLLVQRLRWFAIAVIAAFGMDFYALGYKGVSDYCMSFGYWGLIPTYAAVWWMGRTLAAYAQKKQANPFAIAAYTAFAWLAASIGFILSNAFWYAFSDKVNTLSVVEFSQRVAQYYTPYVGYALMYVGIAWLVNLAAKSLVPHTTSASSIR